MKQQSQVSESQDQQDDVGGGRAQVGYRVLDASDVPDDPRRQFADDVLEGLSERPKRLSSRYIYDDRGSDFFQQIMSLEDYYPTRCEAEILASHGPAILESFVGAPFNLVDLGAGDGAKTLHLLRHLEQRSVDFTYVPIDISSSAVAGLTRVMHKEVPQVNVGGLVAEYNTALRWLARSEDRRNLVLFLGSNIGNFNRSQARAFLRRLWSGLNDGDCVLIGFDLKKDIDLLLHAYNDSEGVTARFNLNLLQRINEELGGNFDLSTFRHYATYDVFSGAMESYLVSLEKQNVYIDALHSDFTFEAWEPVHTEYSYKYLDSDIVDLAGRTGFEIVGTYRDGKGWFTDSLWRVRKSSD